MTMVNSGLKWLAHGTHSTGDDISSVNNQIVGWRKIKNKICPKCSKYIDADYKYIGLLFIILIHWYDKGLSRQTITSSGQAGLRKSVPVVYPHKHSLFIHCNVCHKDYNCYVCINYNRAICFIDSTLLYHTE